MTENTTLKHHTQSAVLFELPLSYIVAGIVEGGMVHFQLTVLKSSLLLLSLVLPHLQQWSLSVLCSLCSSPDLRGLSLLLQ